MKKWQSGAASMALVLTILATGCGKKVDQPEVETTIPPTTVTAEQTLPPTDAPTQAQTTRAPELTARAKKLLAQNPDTVGYIYIDGTKVDNPVVQTNDNEYYLNHGFDGQEFRAGTVFMDCTDIFKELPFPDEWSENIVLYGHNMADNTMFGSIRRYRQDPSYYKQKPFMTFSSNYGDYTYVMVGLVITGGNADSDFRYWQLEQLPEKEDFDNYMSWVEKKNMIENPIDVQHGDRLLTLSTCYSDEDNSRFIIVGRMLREGETEEQLLAQIQAGKSTTPAQ